MSGPVTAADAPPGEPGCGRPDEPEVEVTASREATVGGVAVRRALPRRTRRTVGAWCFADQFGPVAAGGPGPGGRGMEIGPHPHTGLHTVTWLVDGQVIHRDSLGSEQLIRPGQLNLIQHPVDPVGERGGVAAVPVDQGGAGGVDPGAGGVVHLAGRSPDLLRPPLQPVHAVLVIADALGRHVSHGRMLGSPTRRRGSRPRSRTGRPTRRRSGRAGRA